MSKTTRVLIVLAIFVCPSFAQGIITTLAGNMTTCSFTGDGGPASAATFCAPLAPVLDATGNIYVVDNNRVRKIATNGIITTVAGNGQTGTAGDGGPALSANISQVWVRQAAIFGSHFCFADASALKIRCIDFSTGLIAGYGTGTSGTGGDGGSFVSASFMNPSGLAFDSAGNLYISDNAANRVRKVDAVTGVISMFAGPGPGYCCVPLATAAQRLALIFMSPPISLIRMAHYTSPIQVTTASGASI
jgi:hypothetical protein